MLDIPTARAKLPQIRANRQARQQQPESLGSVEGSTSLDQQPAPMTTPPVSDWNAQYGATAEKQATGWKDPIAQQVSKNYYTNLYGNDQEYNRLLNTANEYQSGKYGGYLSPLDPMGMGRPDLQYEYIKAGGQAFSPAEIANNLAITGHSDELSKYAPTYKPASETGMALPGQPYITATGMAAPVMSATGVPVNPNTGQPMVGSGSSHSLSPEVMNRMWR